MDALKDWILAALGFIAQQVMILDSASRKTGLWRRVKAWAIGNLTGR